MFAWMILVILLLVFMRVPIVFSIGIGSLFYCLMSKIDLIVLAQRMTVTIDNFTFLAIPFFLLAGNLMNTGGITERIFKFARSLVGWIKGGLGHVAIVASMIFAGLSGSAIADAIGLGKIEIDIMTKAKYDREFSSALVLASSTIGPIIPPSITMIIYAMVSSQSIGKLLIAGLFPGVLMGLCLMLMVFIIAKKRNYPTDSWPGLKTIFIDFCQAIIPLLTPLIILGGISFGWFTATEAGVVAAVYALLVGLFVYRLLSWKTIIEAFKDTAFSTATIGVVIAICGVFSWIVALEGVPQALANFIFSITTNKILILLILNIVILILGCFIDAGPLVVMLVPVLLPLVEGMGINLIHFGVIIVVNVIIGTITPPVGTCLFAITKVSELPMQRVVPSLLPFLFMLVVALGLITYIPQISMFLPNLLFK
jgi:tripartite ATP-independent transporter DctM subunit